MCRRLTFTPLVVKHERNAEAEEAVRRLQNTKQTAISIPTPHETVALLAETNAFEMKITANVSYLECFKGTNLRRTEIATGTWVAQQMAGPVLQTVRSIYFVYINIQCTDRYLMF